MKTAVLISGQLRTFKKCYPTQKWQIFRHYEPDIHFFASISNDAQAADIELLRTDYPSVNVSIEIYDDPVDLPEIPIEKGKHAGYANATSHPKLMLQHWGNKKVWDFFCSKTDPTSFDAIIRLRPDLWIHWFAPPRNFNPDECFCPWWGKFGGVNDRLAVMGQWAATHYFTLYDSILKLLEKGCPFHPETLLGAKLKSEDVRVYNTLMTEFSTDRMDGSRRWWNQEANINDIAHLL